MTVKNFLRITSLVMIMAIALPAGASSIAPESSLVNIPVKTEETRGQELLQRLKEIRSMDKSSLTRLEKKSLRKEVREIRKEMKKVSGGVYLSVGAIIIIILLLILIL